MFKVSKILTILILFISSSVAGQNGISFAKITVEAATQRANIEDKNIFIDAYAPWCGPCKIMDIHFQDKEVVNYFNRNFINVKIDTDTKYGKVVSAKYGIAFLPTILILDKDGFTRFKVDKLISKEELMSLARYALEGPKYPTPTAPSTSVASTTKPTQKKTQQGKTPSTRKTKKSVEAKTNTEAVVVEAKKEKKKNKSSVANTDENSNEKILYVLDANATNLPPEILYEEAYFRVQLNDGSHKEAARKYLKTQENWFTEKNLKFIFDFLYDTDSDEFKFFVANKESFEQHIGQEKINQSLKILIENKLYQGIPRPTFDQSHKLLSLIDFENADKNNYHYFLNRLYTEGNDVKFLSMAVEYFKKYEKTNQEITIKYIEKKLKNTNSKNKIKALSNLLSNIESPNENFQFLLCNAKLYLALSDKTNAVSFANKAISYAKESKIDFLEAEQILETIKEL